LDGGHVGNDPARDGRDEDLARAELYRRRQQPRFRRMPHGRRPGHLGGRRQFAGPRHARPVRSGWRDVPFVSRHQPDADDVGDLLSRSGASGRAAAEWRGGVMTMFAHYVASVNSIRLHYVSAGSGKPMLFLHGHPDFWYLWKDQLTHFAHTHHVIAPDLRGYNLSDKPPGVADYRIPIVVEDIRSLADNLGLSAFTLVGPDWGAIVAWEFAARHPDFLERLITLSTAPLDVVRSSVRDPLQRSRWTYQLMLTSPQAEQILTAGDYYLYNLTV